MTRWQEYQQIQSADGWKCGICSPSCFPPWNAGGPGARLRQSRAGTGLRPGRPAGVLLPNSGRETMEVQGEGGRRLLPWARIATPDICRHCSPNVAPPSLLLNRYRDPNINMSLIRRPFPSQRHISGSVPASRGEYWMAFPHGRANAAAGRRHGRMLGRGS